MASFPGWSWEYIDEQMTIPRLDAINAYHRKHPPLHLAVAAYLGVGEKARPSELTDDGRSLFDLFPRTPS